LWSLIAVLGLISCSDDDDYVDPHNSPYLPQTSQDKILNNFQVAWRERSITEYSKLLSADYQYYFDPATKAQLGIDFWTRIEDSTRVQCLFNHPDVTKITIDLTWPLHSAQSAGFAPPRHTWTKQFLTDVFLDVDVMPAGSPVTTYRVEDQTQRFFFRRGRTYPPSGPADTLMYIVEWRDDGSGGFKPSTAASQPSTWSSIKTRSNCP